VKENLIELVVQFLHGIYIPGLHDSQIWM